MLICIPMSAMQLIKESKQLDEPLGDVSINLLDFVS